MSSTSLPFCLQPIYPKPYTLYRFIYLNPYQIGKCLWVVIINGKWLSSTAIFVVWIFFFSFLDTKCASLVMYTMCRNCGHKEI